MKALGLASLALAAVMAAGAGGSLLLVLLLPLGGLVALAAEAVTALALPLAWLLLAGRSKPPTRRRDR